MQRSSSAHVQIDDAWVNMRLFESNKLTSVIPLSRRRREPISASSTHRLTGRRAVCYAQIGILLSVISTDRMRRRTISWWRLLGDAECDSRLNFNRARWCIMKDLLNFRKICDKSLKKKSFKILPIIFRKIKLIYSSYLVYCGIKLLQTFVDILKLFYIIKKL